MSRNSEENPLRIPSSFQSQSFRAAVDFVYGSKCLFVHYGHRWLNLLGEFQFTRQECCPFPSFLSKIAGEEKHKKRGDEMWALMSAAVYSHQGGVFLDHLMPPELLNVLITRAVLSECLAAVL